MQAFPLHTLLPKSFQMFPAHVGLSKERGPCFILLSTLVPGVGLWAAVCLAAFLQEVSLKLVGFLTGAAVNGGNWPLSALG